MPIVRKRLRASDVYPDDIRYNSTTGNVERLVDGEWKEAPESDPRKLTTIPPRTSSDPRCDSAANVAAAFKNQLDQIILAIDNGMTALQLAGLLLGLFSFGIFAIFIEIALFIIDGLLGIGATALEAELTPAAYDELTCILYCNMDSEGRIDEAGLVAAIAQVESDMSTVQAFVFANFLDLAGVGGTNNLGALGSITGDCSDCTDCCFYSWSGYYNLLPESPEIDIINPGTSFPASGSVQLTPSSTVVLSFAEARTITKVEMRIARFSSDPTQPVWTITANDTITQQASPALPQTGQLFYREFLFATEQNTATITVSCDGALMHSIRVWYCT